MRALFTELDNQTWCPVRLFGVAFAILSSTTFLGLAIWTVVKQRVALDYVAFGTGLSSVWATVSVAIIAKGRWGGESRQPPSA
ncbi:MAG: hypothetical protein KGL35_11820 [Bradyrhizobium sp.]|nr:hypothetical protein [Bradyrhizobium sp.]